MKTSPPKKEPQKDSVDTSSDTDRTDNNLFELDTGVQLLSNENKFKVQNSVKWSENISKNHVILKLRKVLHEKLEVLKNISYIADTEIALKNAIEGIEEIQRGLVSSCPHQNGIPLRNSPAKKKLKITKNEYHQVFHKKLPKRKKWKRKVSPVKLSIEDEDTEFKAKRRRKMSNKTVRKYSVHTVNCTILDMYFENVIRYLS